MRRIVIVLVVLLVILHQDFWLWDNRGLLWGFLPVGLAYHGLHCIAASGVGWLAVKYAWPEEDEDEEPAHPQGANQA